MLKRIDNILPHIIIAGLILYLFLIPFSRELSVIKISGKSLSLPGIISIILLFAQIVLLIINREFLSKYKYPAMLLLLYFFIAGFLRKIHGGAIPDFLYLAMFFVSLFAMPVVVKSVGLEKFSSYVSMSAVFLLLLHFSALLWKGNGAWGDIGNYIGVFPSKQSSSTLFLYLFPFVIYDYYARRKKYLLIILILITLAVFLTFYRTSILSLFLLTLIIIFRYRKIITGNKILLIGGAVALLVAVALSGVFIQDKLMVEMGKFADGNYAALGGGRVGIILKYFYFLINDMSFTEALFGKGMGFSYLIHAEVVGYISYAHVQFIMLLADTGITGFLLTSLFLFFLLKEKIYLMKEEQNFRNYLSFSILVVFLFSFLYSMPMLKGGVNYMISSFTGFLFMGNLKK